MKDVLPVLIYVPAGLALTSEVPKSALKDTRQDIMTAMMLSAAFTFLEADHLPTGGSIQLHK
jgi:hypothetical protein